ncbi:RHS repeat-associated core domain-containing protein [Permianibacter aggregans]|uniref:RHS repeat-associated protein n=1 Tax=Permianibacter aggregans TaxID=1510150 RepID=A0A4R6URM9_9GAMM|nr:RHS repeat-associated core domain-containing protein [Permianibacter aggregans]QGX39330.1 hypothetical protein E2H98_06520 [Permianibacter aggregans]TDQ49930.1 RHS repeat-associated protein [Permianibacter aggregans]
MTAYALPAKTTTVRAHPRARRSSRGRALSGCWLWEKSPRGRNCTSGRIEYNYFRNYDSITGRYIESDPIGLEAGVNTYVYVEADPLNAFDDFGLNTARPPSVRPRSNRGGTRGNRGDRTNPHVPALEPAYPTYPIRYSTEVPGQCGMCMDIFFVARPSGLSRSNHRNSANRQFWNYIQSGQAPSNIGGHTLGQIAGQMSTGRGLRNPQGFEWHHPINRPNELWLIRQCDHRDPLLQPLLHPLPGRSGGFSQNF